MATKTFTPMLGKRIRVTELDECGAIVEGARNIATDGFISLSISAEVEDGDEILVKKADGTLCVNEKQNDSFKYFNIELQFCGVNPALLAMTTIAEEYEGYNGDVVGVTFGEGEMNSRFALEMWSGLSGQACGEGGEASGYLLLPHISGGILGDIEFTGEDAVDFTLTSAITRGSNSWGVGPYEVVLNDETPAVADVLPTPIDPYDHFLMMFTEVAPPESDDEPQEVPSLT